VDLEWIVIFRNMSHKKSIDSLSKISCRKCIVVFTVSYLCVNM
jgi:hypothetical protein